MKVEILAIFLLAATCADAANFSVPSSYELKMPDADGCRLAIFPTKVAGTMVCSHELKLEMAAIESGLFENNEEEWLLTGPGVPNLAKKAKIDGAELLYGEALCAI